MTSPRPGRLGGVFGAPSVEAYFMGLAGALGPGASLLSHTSGGSIVDGVRDPVSPHAAAWVDAGGNLHLTRDAIGHRSLYFCYVPGGVVFASSIHALVACRAAPKAISAHGLALYLSCAYVPGATTLLEGVFALHGGETLVFRPDGTLRASTRYALPATPAEFPPEEAQRAELRATLERAVRRALPPPGAPVGATLSGGIDSSAVVALVRRLHDGPLETYSVWFGPEHAHELDFSRPMAAHVGAPHRVVKIGPEDIRALLDPTTRALGEPNGDPLTVPNTMLFREASERVSVLFNGEGGDPCFGGPKNAPMLLATLLGDPTTTTAEHYLRAHQRCFDDLEDLRTGPVDRGALEAEVMSWLSDPRWPGFLDRLMAINVVWKGAHHILPKVDQLSAPWGVTPASPLFDREVVEFAFGIPGVLKRRGAEEKYLLKRAVEELLPRAILDRPKSGMMVPVEAWFNGPLLDWARERLVDGLPEAIDRRWVRALLDGPKRGLRPRRGIKIWLLLTLESWWRQLGR